MNLKNGEKKRLYEEFKKERERMVEVQIISRGVRNKEVIEVMKKIPRHFFVPEDMVSYAYDDAPLPIGFNQTISQPYMVAVMTELLQIDKTCRVLEIGTGSGYQTAILASLVRKVYTVEMIKELLDIAREKLDFLGFKNIEYKLGDGSLGWEEKSPFDRILVTAATPVTPPPLVQQVKEKGIVIIPIGKRGAQILTVIFKEKEGRINFKEEFECAFVPLIGKYGYSKFGE